MRFSFTVAFVTLALLAIVVEDAVGQSKDVKKLEQRIRGNGRRGGGRRGGRRGGRGNRGGGRGGRTTRQPPTPRKKTFCIYSVGREIYIR